MPNISTDLHSEYTNLWNKINKKNKYPLERDKYGDPNYNLKKRKSLPNFDAKKIPCIEVSERIFTNSPFLFVGMNPSGADIGLYDDTKNNPNDIYQYTGDSSYYKEMTSFACRCLKEFPKWGVNKEADAKSKYSVLDLFGIVQGTQKVIQNDFLNNPSKYASMFDLFLKYVKEVKPKVIIVANAFVSRVLKRDKDLNLDDNKYDIFYNVNGNMKYDLKENPYYGGYSFSINGARFQLYFSSMLSGQRALDKGSRENLVWLVRNYLRNNP